MAGMLSIILYFIIFIVQLKISLMMATPVCGPDEYYDAVARSCAFCGDICSSADQKQTRGECATQCWNYLERIMKVNDFEHYGDIKSDIKLAILAVTVILVGAIIGLLMYKRKCFCQKKECKDGVKQHIRKCYRYDKNADQLEAGNGGNGEEIPFQENSLEDANKPSENKEQVHHPQSQESKNLMLTSGASNAVGDQI